MSDLPPATAALTPAVYWLLLTRRYFCWACDRLTVRKHRHSDRVAIRLLEEVGR